MDRIDRMAEWLVRKPKMRQDTAVDKRRRTWPCRPARRSIQAPPEALFLLQCRTRISACSSERGHEAGEESDNDDNRDY